MFAHLIEKNKKDAFIHLTKMKKQNVNTIEIQNDIFSYTTKRGITKHFVCFISFTQYKKSKFYPSAPERVDGFYFVEI